MSQVEPAQVRGPGATIAPGFGQLAGHFDCRGISNVVGSGFECQAEYADAGVVQASCQFVAEVSDDSVAVVFVAGDGRVEQRDVDSGLLCLVE